MLGPHPLGRGRACFPRKLNTHVLSYQILSLWVKPFERRQGPSLFGWGRWGPATLGWDVNDISETRYCPTYGTIRNFDAYRSLKPFGHNYGNLSKSFDPLAVLFQL